MTDACWQRDVLLFEDMIGFARYRFDGLPLESSDRVINSLTRRFLRAIRQHFWHDCMRALAREHLLVIRRRFIVRARGFVSLGM